MSISRKISLLLGLLALVMVFQSIDRIIQLEGSVRTFETLASRVDQTLNDIETLSRAADQLDTLAREISSTDDPDDMARHGKTLSGFLHETRNAARTLGLTTAPSQELGQHLDQVAKSAGNLIALRSDVLRLRADREALRADLSANAQAMQAYILPFRVSVLSGMASEGDPRTAESLRLLLSLTGLLVRLEDFLVTDERDQTDTIEADISRLISNAVITLARSRDLIEGDQMAHLLARAHATIADENGLGATGAALRDAVREQSVAAAVLNTTVYEIGAALSDLVGRSEKEIGRVYAEAAATAERRVWSEMIVNAGFGLGIVFAVWIVFARQISARLERLSDSVLRLAAGDLTPVDKPVGKDELSGMMIALEVFRRNAMELRRSNEDLANFAYVASHDLRTPLRAIRDLVDWTIEDQGCTLEPDVRGNLDLIRARADRLSRLLQDLLDYARAAQGSTQVTEVDMAEMVRDIGDLVCDDDGVKLCFHGDRLVCTEVTPLYTILLNLISNAAKHRDDVHVTIDVSVTSVKRGWEIRVSDDGPGIPPRYQDKVFELFQTLQSRDEVEGSGLGLAMVQKLVRHLEASIELVSNPEYERGTTFILRIPLRDMPVARAISAEGFAA